MDFSTLPDNVFFQIIRYLPLKEQVRMDGVNSTFRRMSQFAIADTKSLDISNRGIFNDRFTPLSLVKLMQLCAGSLQEIRFELGDQEKEKEFIGAFTDFYCPNLAKFQGSGGENDVFRSLLTQNVNLKTLIVKGRITDYPNNITSGNLETLECECDEAGLRSLAGRLPNLVHFKVRALFGESPAALDQFLASVPNLETLKIKTIGDVSLKLEEMRLDAFWRLKRLSVLQIEDDPALGEFPNIGDDTFVKMARCFPRIRVLALPADEVSHHGLIALSSLGDLQELTLDYNYVMAELGPPICISALLRLRGLRKLHLAGLAYLHAQFFAVLLRELLGTCPHLSEVSLWDLTSSVGELPGFPATAAEIAAAVGALAVTGKNRPPIRISFNTDKEEARHLWRSDEVIEALEKLKGEQGVKVEFRWPNLPAE